jgi:hypothetical protein
MEWQVQKGPANEYLNRFGLLKGRLHRSRSLSYPISQFSKSNNTFVPFELCIHNALLFFSQLYLILLNNAVAIIHPELEAVSGDVSTT